VIPTWPAPALDYTLEEPYGVVGIIIPWNGPVYAAGMTLAPALAAGNCVILKPPELAPFAAIRLGELFLEAGFPPGVVNVVTAGPAGGDALVRHPASTRFTSPAAARPRRKCSPPHKAHSNRWRWNSVASRPTSSSPTLI